MVKKKRQHDVTDDGASTDSSDEKAKLSPTSAAVGTCHHVKKSVDAIKLRKLLKVAGLSMDCTLCSLSTGPPHSSSFMSSSKAIVEIELNEGFEYDHTLWLCLKCGSQLCGRSRNQHALQHYKTPHSESHALTMNTRSYEIWCYECDNEVNANSRKNLLECVELVKKIAQKPQATVPEVIGTEAEATTATVNNIEDKIKATLETLRPLVTTAATIGAEGPPQLMPPPPPPIPGLARRINDPLSNGVGGRSTFGNAVALPSVACAADTQFGQNDRLPRVRGLTNLGNTCFFNAVMQCLAQTPYLLDVLRESAEPGEEFILPGGTFKFKDNEDVHLPMIKGTLCSWGGLTAALAQALEELQAGGGVFTPAKLFDKLCIKCPQFRGGEQHDSHELLRHLLESVRSEDVKRYQRVILQNLGYKDQDINSVSEEMRQKCKIYGNQASDRILRPEQVFRGFLVSTLTCQECYNVSSRHEYFLDMSLPVSVEKPQPPQRRRNSPDNELPTTAGVAAAFYLNWAPAAVPTRAQLKKDKEKERKAKRAAKHHNKKQTQKLLLLTDSTSAGERSDEAGGASVSGCAPLVGPANDSSSSSSSSEQSDADVEDNLVDDTVSKRGGATVRTAPLYDPNGNSQLPSPANPEKRGDSPENMDKDSLDEDENDSGIATSPAQNNYPPTNGAPLGGSADAVASTSAAAAITSAAAASTSAAAVITSAAAVSTSAAAAAAAAAATAADDAKNSVLAVGLSERGANVVRQLSLGEEAATLGGNNATTKATATAIASVALTNGTDGGAEDATDDGADDATGPATASLAADIEQLRLDEQNATRMKAKRVRTQSYSDWSTTIAPRYQCEDGECSVQSCLNNFTGVELMTGNNKVGCEHCSRRINGADPPKTAKTVNTNTMKQFLISSPPAVLILHLKRFQLGPRCIFRKLTRAVSFPMVLDIAPFCGSKVKNLPNIDRKQRKLLYALYGIVEHMGGMYGGHYTAYVKVRSPLPAGDRRWKFIPQGSKAELDQDDEQRKKLDELLAKEKARELRMKAAIDSDDFSNTDDTNSSCSTSSSAGANCSGASSSDEGTHEACAGAVGGDEEARNVQVPMGKWYYVSDSRVVEVNEEVVLKAQAYLLFYERIY